MKLEIKGNTSKYISIVRNNDTSIGNILKVDYDFGIPMTNYIVEKWSECGYDKALISNITDVLSFIFDRMDKNCPEFEIIHEWFFGHLTDEMNEIIFNKDIDEI